MLPINNLFGQDSNNLKENETIGPEKGALIITGDGIYGIFKDKFLELIGGAGGFVFGYLLFGIDTIRAKVLKRWPAYSLILAAIQPLFFLFTGLSKMLVRIAGLALLGFAWNLWVLAKENVENSKV